MHWHHLVEKFATNMARFGPYRIHNTANLIRLDAGIHAKISGYYSSHQGFSQGMRVRDWIATKSWDEQMEFAIQTLRRFGVSV